MLFLGIALDGTRLADSRTGGMYYSFKIFEYFRRQPGLSVDHDGISSLAPRQWSLMIKLHLVSLYLLLTRGRTRYDCIFVSGAWGCALYLLFAKLRGSRVVALWFHRTSKQPELGSARRAIERLKEWSQLRIADAAVVISRSTLHSLRELGFVGDDYVLAPPGLDKDLWRDRTSSYDRDRPGFRIVCAGGVVPHKGVMDLVVAFAGLLDNVASQDERSALAMDIVGNDRLDPAFTADLHRLIRDRGIAENVFLRGKRPLRELMDYYRGAAVFVHPSRYEGWGMVVLEAASFGLPLIVSDGGALPEVVRNGEYGIVYRAGDCAALQEQLALLLRDKDRRTKLSAKAAALYRRAITWEDTGRLIETYLARPAHMPAGAAS